MTNLMTFDVATTTGWAFWEDWRLEPAIQTGSFKCEGKTPFEKVRSMRGQVPDLIRRYKPDLVAIEAPLTFVPRYEKKSTDLLGEKVEETINAHSIFVLNRLNGACQMAVEGFNIPVVEVAPKTWQAIIPKEFQGPPKKRAKDFCESLNISATNIDSRDAAIIAVWLKGHSQELKLQKLAGAA